MMVKCLNKNELHERVDTSWRSHLHLGGDVKPARRGLLTKRVADLQWRLLHGAVAVSAFLIVINRGVSDVCPLCPHKDIVFHCFSECVRSSFVHLVGEISPNNC